MQQQWWRDYPWRMVQTNMREIDMADIDAMEYVRQLKDFNATVALINVGGIIASYPTDLCDHYQSQYLQGDPLSKIIDACHAENIKVIARMDFSKIRYPIYERHPEWAYRRANGEIINYNGDVHACICGGYQQEYSLKIIREALEKFPLDGVFLNMGGFQEQDYSHVYHGFCHCDSCKRLFRERYGFEIPLKADMNDPAYRAYLCFKDEVVSQERKRLVQFVRGIHPGVAIAQEDFFRMESNTEFRRPLPYWQYSASCNTRALRGLNCDKVVSNTTVDFVGFYYRHVAVSAPQQKLRLWQNLANLGGLDYYMIGRLDNHLDRTAYRGVKEIFAFHKAREKEFKNLVSVADVLLMRSRIWNEKAEERGWARALMESHILFDEVLISEAAGKDLSKYRAIILPDMDTLADEVVSELDAYAKAGGTLIVCGLSGQYDSRHQPRSMPCFSSLGMERVIMARGVVVSAMLLAGDKDKQRFPSMGDTDVLMVGDDYIYAQYKEDAEKFLSLIPPQPFGPPERCYQTQVTNHPGAVVYPCGKGKGIFIPWLPGQVYYREGYENTFFFMHDVLTSLAGIKPVSEDLTEMAEVTAALGDGYLLVQLVNNSGHFGTSYMKPVPIADVSVTIPCLRHVKEAVSLVDGRQVPFVQAEGGVRLSIGTLHEYEGIKLLFE